MRRYPVPTVLAGAGLMFLLSRRAVSRHGRDALGAEVRMSVGARAIRTDVRAAYSYLSSNDPRVHVGTGQETAVRNAGRLESRAYHSFTFGRRLCDQN